MGHSSSTAPGTGLAVVAIDALEELIEKVVARAIVASRSHMTSKELAVWLGITPRTWRRACAKDPGLRALALVIPSTDGAKAALRGATTKKPRLRWPAVEVKAYLRQHSRWAPRRVGRA